jgi:glycosyltransferase involved in cell wall biosynthesis
VVIEHGGVLLNPAMTSRRRYLTQRVVRRLWARDVAAEVCVSEYMAARQRALPHARRIRVIHNGVDLERFRPCERIARHSTLRVAAAGSLVPAKGFSVLVDAVGICRSRGREVVLHIAGQGPESDALARLACSWDMLGDQVLVGRVDDMAGFLVEHDLAVMPSLCEESFGMVAVEAQACGLPVVASRVGALAEVVNDDRSGLLVEPGNPEKLAAALLAYADDADMLRVHSSAAREWAEARFSLDVAAEAYERLFHEVIQAA